MYQLTEENGRLVYRDTTLGIALTVPEGCTAQLKQTPAMAPLGSEEQVAAAIRTPASGSPLPEIAAQKKAKSACILVSDATRAVPTARLARVVIEELVRGGIALGDIHCFVAIGVHRPATEEEMRTFLGGYYGKVSVENHTPFDPDNLICLGETSRGTPIEVNRRAYDCDLHIQIGKVEPHEFAGYSGGRKSVLPGVSSQRTIQVNHRPEMILNPRSAIGSLEGNPVHEDMLETAQRFGIDFAVNCILNQDLELAAVFAGTLEESHRQAVDFASERLAVRLERPDVIVTTPGQPLDIDFYQTVKALIALTEAADGNTTIVLLCGCREGVNSPDMLRAFRSGGTLEEAVAYTVAHYEIQMDHVLLLSKLLRKGVRVIVSCPNVSDEEIRDMYMVPGGDPQSALELALRGRRDAHILFYPRPQTGLPVLAE